MAIASSNSYTDVFATATTGHERLWSELKIARQEAEHQRATAEKAYLELVKEKEVGKKHVARVAEVEEDLKGLCTQRDALQKEKDKLTSKLATASSACGKATTQARADCEVLQ